MNVPLSREMTIDAQAQAKTARSSTWLLDFKSDVYSQTGEDGIIQKALETLHKNDEWCVEFGAWDGKHYSTTCNLIESRRYSAVLIEGDRKKYQELLGNHGGNDRVTALNQYVGFAESDGLDQILSKTRIPKDFDFLSIDIDGNDYHVWEAMSYYEPKLVCIEFNPTIPNEVRFVQPADPAVNIGSSLSALVELGKSKCYELVAVLPFNAFFVKTKYYDLFRIRDNRPEVMRTYLGLVTYAFSGYDGTLFLAGHKKLPWHGLELQQGRMQPLPRFLRKYPPNYNKLQVLAFEIRTNPMAFFRRLPKRLLRLIKRPHPEIRL